MKKSRYMCFESLGEGLDELVEFVVVVLEDGWMWNAGHVNPVVGAGIIPAWLCFWPVTVNTLLLCCGLTVGW